MTIRHHRLWAIASFAAALTVAPSHAALVFVNELHYDNAGGDVAELVELAGEAGLDLTGWSLLLYNGASGSPYASIGLGGAIPDEGSGMGAIGFTTTGIQNGAPDGLAVIDPSGSVVELLSYEGSFLAAAGAAAGHQSIDIGVAENGTDAPGFSLQRIGSGRFAGDFIWSEPLPASPGRLNDGQSIAPPAVPLPPAGIVFASALAALLGARLARRGGDRSLRDDRALLTDSSGRGVA